MSDLIQDLRFGMRMLLRSPGFTIVAALSLALGIGANTTIFTVINAVFLSPLPVKDVSSLAMIFTTDTKQGGGPQTNLMALSFPNFLDLRDQSDIFEGLAAFSGGGGVLVSDEGPVTVQGFLVTTNYFDVLGVKAAYGRTFYTSEDQPPGAHPVMVISHGLWERQFGSDPEIVGRTLKFNGALFTVIGVAPAEFKGTIQGMPGDLVWTPMSMYRQVLPAAFQNWPESRRALIMNAFGRLKPGTSLAMADAAMKTIAAGLEKEYPEVNEARSVQVTRFTPFFNPNQERQLRLVGGLMMAIVGIVLLIACVNIANLLLARATAREGEIGIRLAMGAGRGRLVGQLLAESVLLAAIGGVAGLLLALWGRQLLWQVRPPFLPEDSITLNFDYRVLAFTIALSLGTGIIFGLIPALQASKTNLVETLYAGGRSGSASRGQLRLRRILVVSEVALALVTLVGAGLFVRSMRAAQRINPGFETERLASVFINPSGAGYDPARTEQFYREALTRLAAIGGVARCAFSSGGLMGGGLMRSVIPEGAASSDRGILTMNNTISPGYFETLGVPLLRGRDFSEFDTADKPAVAIINEATRRRFWPDEDPIGKRFHFITEEFTIEIVGVVKDTLLALGQPPQPVVYLPYRQRFMGAATMVVRTSRDAEAVLGEVQKAFRSMDRNLPVTNAATMSRILDQALWAPRMGASLLGVFGALALVLSMVGIYGVMSYSVNQRIREMGVRIALGARPGNILGIVLRQGTVLVFLGIAIGLLLAAAAGRFLASLLYEISPTDPLTLAGISGLLAMVSMIACFIPAWRATRVDPIIALRYE